MKKRFLRIAMFALAALAVLVAAFYTWTDWAGARHRKAVENSLRAKGEPLTIAEIEPQPIAAESNIAAAPIFAEIARVRDRKQWRISAIQGFTGSYKKGASALANAARKVDPTFAGSDADAARVVLNETAKWKPQLDEVRAAARRPGTVWPSDYRDGFRIKLDQISPLLVLAQALSAEAMAYLELGNPDAAFADFQLILNLADRSREPPLLITHLVRQSMLGRDVEVVRFGIERRVWTPAMLETIQRELAGTSLLSGLASGFRNERVLFIDSVTKMSGSGFQEVLKMGSPENTPDGVLRFASMVWELRPAGWSDEDRSTYARILQPIIDWLGDAASDRPQSILKPDETLEQMKSNPLSYLRTPLSLLALPTLLSIVQKAVYAQATLDEAGLACAIERYRLAQGSLPATLEGLQPGFLSEMPKDPIGGEPFRYQVTGADSYILYSVGWNGTDDHGSEKRPSPKALDKSEDWVWKMGGSPQ